MILLVYPPASKPCEPPAGISRLSGTLRRHNVEHTLLDANLEGLLYLLGQPFPAATSRGPWARRAFRDCARNIAAIRDHDLYRNLGRYKRVVSDLNKVLRERAPAGITHGLADYGDRRLSAVRSRDLLAAADKPSLNPYYPYFSSRLREIFDREGPSLVGISLNYLSQALCTFSMIGFLRREFPGVTIALGGGLVTSWLKGRSWDSSLAGIVDHAVAGPGESQLLSLLGFGDEDGGMPRPAYGSLPRDDYFSPGFILPYSASTGCPWNRCTFCPEAAEGQPYVSLPPHRVIADLQALVRETKPALVHFLDNALSPGLLESLCGDAPGVPWYGFSRIGPQLADPDFCRALRQAGCVMLKLGVESGDQKVLDTLKKGVSLDMASGVLKNLKQAGIAAYVYLLFGTPEETEASARQTLAFTVRHSDCIGYLNLALFNMPARGHHAGSMATKRFSEGDLSLYADFAHPRGWDRRSVRSFLQHTFAKHPAVSAILKCQPPVFTSNHAPFFVLNRPGSPGRCDSAR